MTAGGYLSLGFELLFVGAVLIGLWAVAFYFNVGRYDEDEE